MFSHKCQKRQKYYTSIILFKEDFTEEEKNEIYRAAKAVVVDEEFENIDDYEDIWFWFLHSYLVSFLKNEHINAFVDDANYRQYLQLVELPKRKTSIENILKYLPVFKKGNVEISKDPKMTIDFEWVDKEKRYVKFSEIIKRLRSLFPKLKTTKDANICILIDELELRRMNKAQYKRDSKLIRDLIISIDRFNRICKNSGFNVACLAAIRTEVVNSIYTSGKEIDKLIRDFGHPIIWNMPGSNDDNHPLLNIIEGRFEQYTKTGNVWMELFPEIINRMPAKKYLLHYSWFRPRDLIRMLMLIQELMPSQEMFSHDGFDGIRKTYATESWKELSEELVTKYTIEQLGAVKKLLNGINNPFDLNDIYRRYRSLPSDIKSYLDVGVKIETLLEDLYTIGIIGNHYVENGRPRTRYSFRGDDDLFIDKDMILHYGIRPYFTSI
jgi:hypothetical protein